MVTHTVYFIVTTLYCSIVLFLFVIRLPELSALVLWNAPGAFLVTVASVGMVSLFISPSKSYLFMMRRFALLTMVVAMIKQNLDHDLKLSLKFRDLSDHVSIVTGGNSGTGLAVAKQLVRLGSTVVITCRSDTKCQTAVEEISALYPPKKHLILPMRLDLNDLTSVKSFAKDFLRRYNRLDILVNNAGLVADPGAVTAQGLEQSFGAMHIGHFALTRYLLKLMLKPLPGGRNLIDAARVVNIASDAFMSGNFHPTFMEGSGAGDLNTEITDNCGTIGPVNCCPLLSCPTTNGYARAKLANIMHAFELQRRVDEHITTTGRSSSSGASKKFRRLVTSSLHPGSVHTNISPFLASGVMALFLRSSDQAAHVILRAILEDSFVPSSYLDGMGHAHDLFSYQERHLDKHFRAFPESRALPFGAVKPSDDHLSLQHLAWSVQSVIAPLNHTASGERVGVDFRKDTVAARLWDVSEQIVKDWESNRPILKTEVLSSSGFKLTL